MAPLELISNATSDVASSEYVTVSPVSGSVASTVTTDVPAALFSSTDAVVSWPVNTGASFTFATTMSKVSLTVALLESVAVTFTESVPTSAFAGVPAKVRVFAVNTSQVGRAESSDCAAE